MTQNNYITYITLQTAEGGHCEGHPVGNELMIIYPFELICRYLI